MSFFGTFGFTEIQQFAVNFIQSHKKRKSGVFHNRPDLMNLQ